jgi:hypothetical protein
MLAIGSLLRGRALDLHEAAVAGRMIQVLATALSR